MSRLETKTFENETRLAEEVARLYEQGEYEHAWGNDVLILNPLEDRDPRGAHTPLVSLVEKALRGLCMDTSSVIILLGPSGAGKTTTIQQILAHIKSLPEHGSVLAGESPQHARLYAKYAALAEESSRLLGNARTASNRNSSRIVKITQVHFDKSLRFIGVQYRYHLLEATRVCKVKANDPDEANFHIFELGSEGEHRLRHILQDLDFSQAETDQTMSHFLLVQRLRVTIVGSKGDLEEGDKTLLARLLGCPAGRLQKWIKDVDSGDIEGAIQEKVASLAAYIYLNIFKRIVTAINVKLGQLMKGTDPHGSTIDLVDIFGPENTGKNGLNTLKINHIGDKTHALWYRASVEEVIDFHRQSGASAEALEQWNSTLKKFLTRPLDAEIVMKEIIEATKSGSTRHELLDNLRSKIPSTGLPSGAENRFSAFNCRHYGMTVTYLLEEILQQNNRVDVKSLLSSSKDANIRTLLETTQSTAQTDLELMLDEWQTITDSWSLKKLFFIHTMLPNKTSSPRLADVLHIRHHLQVTRLLDSRRCRELLHCASFTKEDFVEKFTCIIHPGNKLAIDVDAKMTIILSNLNSECYDEVEGKIFLKSRGLNELERQLYLRNKVLFDENAVRSTLESEVTDGQIMNHTPTRADRSDTEEEKNTGAPVSSLGTSEMVPGGKARHVAVTETGLALHSLPVISHHTLRTDLVVFIAEKVCPRYDGPEPLRSPPDSADEFIECLAKALLVLEDKERSAAQK